MDASSTAVHAIVFDLDGVLIDSEGPAATVIRQMLAEEDVLITEADTQSIIGRPAEHLRLFLADRLNQDMESVSRFSRRYRDEVERLILSGAIRPFAAAQPLLEALHREQIPTAIATSGGARQTAIKIQACGWYGLVDHIVTRADVRNGKPAPDSYLLAAERLEIAPGNCIAVEDSPVGVTSAATAGMEVWAVESTHPHSALSEAHRIFPELRVLAAELRRTM